MIRMLITFAIRLGANAIGLLVAAWILEGMTINSVAFVIAVAIFTLVEVVAQPLIASIAVKHAQTLMGGTALVTTFVGLLITNLVSSGLSIRGIETWIGATVIVWLAALLAGLLIPVVFVKAKVAERQS